METTPITGLDEFDKHLDDLVQDPALTLNPKLFDDVELQLTGKHVSRALTDCRSCVFLALMHSFPQRPTSRP
jgi:hypothetical protein